MVVISPLQGRRVVWGTNIDRGEPLSYIICPFQGRKGKLQYEGIAVTIRKHSDYTVKA